MFIHFPRLWCLCYLDCQRVLNNHQPLWNCWLSEDLAIPSQSRSRCDQPMTSPFHELKQVKSPRWSKTDLIFGWLIMFHADTCETPKIGKCPRAGKSYSRHLRLHFLALFGARVRPWHWGSGQVGWDFTPEARGRPAGATEEVFLGNAARPLESVHWDTHEGFLKWGYAKMDGFYGKIL